MINTMCDRCESVTYKGALIDAVETCENCKESAKQELIDFYRTTPVRWYTDANTVQQTLHSVREAKSEWRKMRGL